ELCNIDSKKTISKEDNIVYIRDGWGTDTRGSYWKRGDYLWETYIDAQLVGSKKFYIEDNGLVTLNENPYFDVNSLKFYIGGAEGIIKDRRVYLKKINRKTAQYLFAEFSFINKSENDWFCELFFNFYDDANQLKGQVSSIKYIEKNRKDEIITLEEGWGNSTPGTWIDDSYSVEIVFMDTLVAVASFEVGDEEENGEVEVFSSSDKCTILKTSSINIKEPESIDEVLKELNSLIGLEQIKKKINEHITY
ncbi:MAG: AAA family ATPase, partial [Bacteroidetes bacterium CG_4_10_14_3_um_filter_31_20]